MESCNERVVGLTAVEAQKLEELKLGAQHDEMIDDCYVDLRLRRTRWVSA